MDIKSIAITAGTVIVVLFILGMVKVGAEKKPVLDIVTGK